MSDFYIFLEEDKGFTEEDIENLSKKRVRQIFSRIHGI